MRCHFWRMLTPRLIFNLVTSNETDNQYLSCTIHLPSLVMICPLPSDFCVLECTHTSTHTHNYRVAERPTHAFDYVSVSKKCIIFTIKMVVS